MYMGEGLKSARLSVRTLSHIIKVDLTTAISLTNLPTKLPDRAVVASSSTSASFSYRLLPALATRS